MGSKLPLDSCRLPPQCLPRDLLQPDVMSPRSICEAATPRDSVLWPPVVRGHPLSQTLPTHTLGPATLRPQSLPPAVSTGLLLGFLPINSGFLTTASASWLSPIIIYLGELLVFQRPALSSITSLWVQMLASVQEWCEHERLWNQTHLGLFHT